MEKVFRDTGSRQEESAPGQPMLWSLSGWYLGKTDPVVDGGVCAVTTGSPETQGLDLALAPGPHL